MYHIVAGSIPAALTTPLAWGVYLLIRPFLSIFFWSGRRKYFYSNVLTFLIWG